MYKNLLIILIIILVIILFIIPILSLLFDKNTSKNINVSVKADPLKKFCHTTPIECNNNKDCTDICIDNMEYSCQLTNNKKKYCLPENKAPTFQCISKNGGVPVWSGWGDTNRMEWDCFCLYPQYFGGPGCTNTPGVCDIGNTSFMDYNANSKISPTPNDCKLTENLKSKGYVIRIRDDGTPIIMSPDQLKLCPTC